MKINKDQSSPIKSGYASDTTLADHYDVSRATIWRWSKSGRLPKPKKLSAGCTRWKWTDIFDKEEQA